MNIDYEELMKQEPEFRQFVIEAIFMSIPKEEKQQMIAVMHSMYIEGLRAEQVARIIKAGNDQSNEWE